MQYNFCPKCGHPLEQVTIDNVQRDVCPQGDYTHWNDCTISAGGVLLKDDRALLVRRTQNPGKGNWINPGGFVEQTDHLDEAVTREFAEELVIQVRANQVVMVGDQPRENAHNVYVTFQVEYLSGKIRLNSENDAYGFYSLAEMDTMQVPDFTKEVVKATLSSQVKLQRNPLDELLLSGYRFFNR